LAVQGPFSGYLTKSAEPGLFEWDLRLLDGYQTRPGLYRLGVLVRFTIDRETRRLRPVTIESELGRSTPTDANWGTARQIALCAVSTHTSLVRHWNWVHLIGGEYLSIVTRNAISEHHPMCGLLWAHLFGTQASNRLCTESQLVPKGDFETVFSYEATEMYRLFRDTVGGFTVQVWDPEAFARARGILQAGFDTPTESNLQAIFDVMCRHTARYIALYYGSDQEVRADQPLCRWLEDLNRHVPNGIPINSANVTRDSLARFAASCIYLATVQHDLLGSFLWNYQVWTHAIPCRVYKDGMRDPIDLYQRLVNTNFMLNASRTPLLTDLTPLALYESAHPERQSRAVEAFRSFTRELQALQQAMEGEGWAPWKVYPAMLEVNINA
jgi:arachidonate 15-lipoxygenase